MKLPKWEVLKVHYPVLEAGIVFKNIGGKVELNHSIGVFNNACAIRISRALNGWGGPPHPIYQGYWSKGKSSVTGFVWEKQKLVYFSSEDISEAPYTKIRKTRGIQLV